MVPTPIDKAKALFRCHGGLLRTGEALRLGIHPRTLYAMRDEGVLEQLSRGLYRLAELPPLGFPDLVAVARKVPAGVICLISALAFHELSTQIPHVVYIALARGMKPPRLDYPPARIFWFTGEAFTEGVAIHRLDHIAVPVYTPEKTLADCFKYRNKLGLDVAVEDADYEGVRVRFRGSLGTVRITMQLDIGFGDVVVPQPATVEYPTILPLPVPRLHGYSRESAVAEKFEAMVKLGMLNSRLKDFFDIWLLSRQFDFDGKTLATAIAKTFGRRRTAVPAEPVALTDVFAADTGKQTQWRGFLRRNRLQHAPDNLADVVTAIAAFLGPIAKALASGNGFEHIWQAPGPWHGMDR